MQRQFVLPATLALAFITAVACSSSENSIDEDLSQRRAPIIGGIPDTGTENDAVVMIYNQISQYSGGMCTGTLIAKNVVLTARHCVSETTEYVDCVNDVIGDHDPKDLYILRGYDPESNQSGSFLGQGKQLFHDGATGLCGHDIALILLSSKIYTVPPIPVRVNSAPQVNEVFRAIGYGLTSAYDQYSAGRRYYRDGVRVTDMMWGTADFIGTQSICQGDSGGPAISAAGAVFGVTSRGGNCMGNDNVWTRTDPFKSLIDQAVAAGGETYIEESGGGTGGTAGAGGTGGSGGGGTGGAGGGTSSGGVFGEACAPENLCADGFTCVDDLGSMYCTSACSADAPDCAPGYECAVNAGLCFKRKTCLVAEDCAPGSVCVDDGTLYCAPLCGADGSCPGGYRCATDQNICYKAASPYDASGSDGTCAMGGPSPGRGALYLTAIAALGAAMWRRRRNARG